MVGRGHEDGPDEDCRRCYFAQVPAINDQFFLKAVRPYCWFAAVLLFLSYIIGLWFTLRTHAATIWNIELEEKRAQPLPGLGESMLHQPMHGSMHRSQHLPAKVQGSGSSKGSGERNPSNPIRDTQLYKRILNQSLKQQGLGVQGVENSRQASVTGTSPQQPPHRVPPKSNDGEHALAPDNASQKSIQVTGLTEEENHNLVIQVAEMAATAAAVAARDAVKAPRKTSASANTAAQRTPRPSTAPAFPDEHEAAAPEGAAGGDGGHDAPNWGKLKSAVILMGATVLYAVIAEILVNTVDVVLESVDIDEKFLGITLFALVPNTTEFLNAISFAMNGNIALSMEIGSAYALQVCLLQIPALVLFSAIHGQYISPEKLLDHTFNLIFPQWDMVTVILCVFLLSYVYGEGKSNYFKGSILVLTYLVIVVGFYLAGYSSDVEMMGVERFEGLGVGHKSSFRMVGRRGSGRAF